MTIAAKPTRENRTISVDFRDEATYVQLLCDGKAFLECVMAFMLSLGFQLRQKATCRGGGCLTRHSHYVRVRLGSLTIWRVQCTTCHAVFTVLPHFVLRYHQMRPEVARNALLATHGGLSLERCAVICHLSPMAIYCLVCAFGQQSLVAVLTRCGLALPVYVLADEKRRTMRPVHARGLAVTPGSDVLAGVGPCSHIPTTASSRTPRPARLVRVQGRRTRTTCRRRMTR